MTDACFQFGVPTCCGDECDEHDNETTSPATGTYPDLVASHWRVAGDNMPTEHETDDVISITFNRAEFISEPLGANDINWSATNIVWFRWKLVFNGTTPNDLTVTLTAINETSDEAAVYSGSCHPFIGAAALSLQTSDASWTGPNTVSLSRVCTFEGTQQPFNLLLTSIDDERVLWARNVPGLNQRAVGVDSSGNVYALTSGPDVGKTYITKFDVDGAVADQEVFGTGTGRFVHAGDYDHTYGGMIFGGWTNDGTDDHPAMWGIDPSDLSEKWDWIGSVSDDPTDPQYPHIHHLRAKDGTVHACSYPANGLSQPAIANLDANYFTASGDTGNPTDEIAATTSPRDEWSWTSVIPIVDDDAGNMKLILNQRPDYNGRTASATDHSTPDFKLDPAGGDNTFDNQGSVDADGKFGFVAQYFQTTADRTGEAHTITADAAHRPTSTTIKAHRISQTGGARDVACNYDGQIGLAGKHGSGRGFVVVVDDNYVSAVGDDIVTIPGFRIEFTGRGWRCDAADGYVAAIVQQGMLDGPFEHSEIA